MSIKLGIIGAMDVEVELLHSNMQNVRHHNIAQLDIWEGTLDTCDVCVVRCGVGKVNAALTAELLIERFQVTHLINTGVAGSLSDELSIGDIVVSSDCVHHDLDVSSLGYAPGQIPGIAVFSFEADEQLQDLALEAAKKLAPEKNIMKGRIASGDQFIANKAANARIAHDFDAACCEMEGTAIAQVAWLNEVPFVIVRAISDGANDTSDIDYPSFERAAAKLCAAIVQGMVKLAFR